VKSAQDRHVHIRLTLWEIIVIADLDTLLIALYVQVIDRITQLRDFNLSGPGTRPMVTAPNWSAWRWGFDNGRHWLSAARWRWDACSGGCWPEASTTPG